LSRAFTAENEAKAKVIAATLKDGTPLDPQLQAELKSELLSFLPRALRPSCASCGGEGNFDSMKKCGRCKAVSYCSKKCQADHWKVRKPHTPQHHTQRISFAMIMRASMQNMRF
jgi:hypothetical protein